MTLFERIRDRFESFLCILISTVCMLLTACCGVGMALIVNERSSPTEKCIWICITVVLAIIEIVSMNFIVKGYNAGLRPLAPTLAMKQPRWPVWFAPLVAAYWMIHWLVFLGLMLLCEHGMTSVDSHGWPLIAAYTAIMLGAFGISYSANVYLLLMVASVRRSIGLIDRIWRWRVAIDLTLVAVAIMFKI